MAAREISQFTAVAAGGQSPNYILPVVDLAAGHVAAANLQISLTNLFSDLGLNTSDGAIGMTGLLAAPSASAAGKLKWYYNNATKQWLASIDGGSYYAVQRSIAAGLTPGWLPYVDTGGILNGSANATLDGNGAIFCKFVTVQSAVAGLNSVAAVYDSAGLDRWEIRLGASNQLIFNDFVNNKDVVTLTPGATPVITLVGTLRWSTDNGFDIGLTGSGRPANVYVGTSVVIGRSNSTTGLLTFRNSSNANTVTIQSGASAASVTYTWPTNFGVAGSVLTDAAGNGTLSWTAAAGITGSIAANQVAYGSGANTIQGSANLTYDGTTLALTGAGTLTAGSSSTVPLKVKLAASPSVDAVQIQTSTGTVIGGTNRNGYPYVGATDTLWVRGSAGVLWASNDGTNASGGFAASVIGLGNGYGNMRWQNSGALLQLRSDFVAQWSNSTDAPGGTKDTGFARNGAGILEINNGVAGTYRDLRVRYLGAGMGPTAGVISVGGASGSGAYIGISTSSQAANDKFISIAAAGSITGLLYNMDTSATATTGFKTRWTNTENATATSDTSLVMVVGGGSAGDPFINFSISGVTDWSIGIDNSVSDQFVIAASTALGTTNKLVISTGGTVTLSNDLVITGKQKNLTVSTGAGSALLGANSPAATLTAPFEWINVTLSDGSTGYVPAWK